MHAHHHTNHSLTIKLTHYIHVHTKLKLIICSLNVYIIIQTLYRLYIAYQKAVGVDLWFSAINLLVLKICIKLSALVGYHSLR